MERPNGYILAQDDDRVVIVTGVTRVSDNSKTSDMLQVWILATAQDPVATVRMGADDIICGDCIHRGPFGKRTCYVNVVQAPLAIWRAWQRGAYPWLPKSRYADVFTGRVVRWGAYGDPAFIPLDVIRWASFFARGWTGYTHQWRNPAHAALKPFVMASCDSEQDRIDARARGWRTFRVRDASEPLMSGEIVCPASNEAGHLTSCADCRLCDGRHDGRMERPTDQRKDIAIIVHGVGARNFKPQLIQIGALA